MTSYADGVKLKDKTSNILTAQNLNIPPNSTVLAIRCHKTKQSPKILGTVGVSIVTSSKGWVCTNEYYPAWNSTKFVDTSWASAVAYWKSGNLPYGKVENISSAAEWIGTNNSTADSLYCRFRLCPRSGNTLWRRTSDRLPTPYFGSHILHAYVIIANLGNLQQTIARYVQLTISVQQNTNFLLK